MRQSWLASHTQAPYASLSQLDTDPSERIALAFIILSHISQRQHSPLSTMVLSGLELTHSAVWSADSFVGGSEFHSASLTIPAE
jgi:hypothetical protein